MTDEFEHGALRLIGWYGSEGHGYSVPLFGQTEGANTLCIARCSVSGDHRGAIADFEPVDVSEYRRLPLGGSIPLAPGDRWHDVFVWDSVGYVGTPDVLWRALEKHHGELAELAPVSFLELALYAGREEVSGLGRLAFDFVDGRFNEQVARRWRRQFVRQWLETEVRRELTEYRHEEASYRSVAVEESGTGGLTAILPTAVGTKLREAGALSDVSARFVGLGAALGAEVIPLGGLVAGAAVSEPAEVLKGEQAESHEDPVDGGMDVAVIAVGRRARGIVTLLRRSLKAPWALTQLAKDGEELVSSGGRGRQRSLDWATVSAATIMLLVDEDELEGAESQRFGRYLRERVDAGALVILVPALPISHPSRVFERKGTWASMVGGYHAILDTAMARSPFWWGNPKRSLDRRIADVVAVSGAACGSARIRELLRARGTRGSPLILAVGLWSRGGAGRYEGRSPSTRLGSEATWASDGPKGGERVIVYSSDINLDGARVGGGEGEVIAELRRNVQRFGEFAGAVVAHALAGNRGGRGMLFRPVEEDRRVPDVIGRELVFPQHSRGFRVERAVAAAINLAVVGESPTVAAVAAADSAGWRIARYTDLATIRRVGQAVNGEDALPDEIDLGTVRSSQINRQVATRGVDQRDVCRFSQKLFQEWLSMLPAAKRRKAKEAARPMRAASRPPGERAGDYVVKREYLHRSDDPAAEELAELLRRKQRYRGDWRTPKRGADLRRCWMKPSEGFRRFALVDGSIPVIVLELKSNEVPVEDLFVVDGDGAVPALFRSRVFRIWAGATLPSASSWMARFSVTSTFGGFPIVEPFRIVGQEGSHGALVATEAPPRLNTLVQEVDRQIGRHLAAGSKGWKAAHESGSTGGAMDRVDEIILDWYGLRTDASGVDVLGRLLELNAMLR